MRYLLLLSLIALVAACPNTNNQPPPGDDDDDFSPTPTPSPTPSLNPPLQLLIPAGALAFADGDTCPSGWTQRDSTKGRFLVGVNDPPASGVLVGTPLSAGEVRSHAHDYNFSIDIASISGITGLSGCCNDSAAANNDLDVQGVSSSDEALLPYVYKLLCSKDGDPTATADGDPYPTDTVLLFARDSCPQGWDPYTQAAGRMIVGLPDTGTPAAVRNTPLSDGEIRSHSHPFSGAFNLPVNPIAGSGGSNRSPGAQGSYPFSGLTGATDTDMPYEQAMVCVKIVENDPERSTAGDRVDSGTKAFFRSGSCPMGWSADSDMRGRFILGLMDGATPNDAFGTRLNNQEDREHSHIISGSVTLGSASLALVSGCCHNEPGARGNHSYNTNTDSTSSGIPYIQLLGCSKNP